MYLNWRCVGGPAGHCHQDSGWHRGQLNSELCVGGAEDWDGAWALRGPAAHKV